MQCEPIFSKILSLYAEQNDLKFAVPGGLIGVGTRVDPTLTRADRLVGQVLGLKGNLPDVFTEVIAVCNGNRRLCVYVCVCLVEAEATAAFPVKRMGPYGHGYSMWKEEPRRFTFLQVCMVMVYIVYMESENAPIYVCKLIER